MNVAKRTKNLQALLDLRIGPGAAVLPSDVKRIHLHFARKINDGHFGARKLWRNHLPRLKYYNPAVSMTVNRTEDQGGPATLTIFFAPPTNPLALSSSTNPSAAPSSHSPSDRVEVIDIKHQHESEILSQLLDLTKGQPHASTLEEQAELRNVEDQKRVSQRDREAQMKLNEVRRQEQALLDQARGLGVENA